MTWKLRLFGAFCIILLITLNISCNKQISVSEPQGPAYNTIVKVNSNPVGAAIFLDGDNTGKLTPDSITNLEPGEYIITLKKRLFLDTLFVLEIKNDSIDYLYVNYYEDIRNYGIISCISEPPGSDIFINDSLIDQKTPCFLNYIWPGKYEVKYAYPVHRADSTSIIVPAIDTTLAFLELQDTTYAVDYNYYNSDFPTVLTSYVAIDKYNHKWIGTRNKGLVFHDDKSWVVFNKGNSILPSNNINSIFIDSKNRKWIGTCLGLVLIDENDIWRMFNTENSLLPDNYVTEIAEDSKGLIWLASSSPSGVKAICKYDENSFTSYGVQKIITAMAIDQQDRIWVAVNDSLKLFDGYQWRSEITDTMRIQGKLIDALACDHQNRIYFGARVGDPLIRSGLYVYDINTGSLQWINGFMVSHINITDNGYIWISEFGKFPFASDAVPPDLPMIHKMDYQFNITSYSMSSTTIRGFFMLCSAAQSNGDLWLASRYKGIIKFKGANF